MMQSDFDCDFKAEGTVQYMEKEGRLRESEIEWLKKRTRDRRPEVAGKGGQPSCGILTRRGVRKRAICCLSLGKARYGNQDISFCFCLCVGLVCCWSRLRAAWILVQTVSNSF